MNKVERSERFRRASTARVSFAMVNQRMLEVPSLRKYSNDCPDSDLEDYDYDEDDEQFDDDDDDSCKSPKPSLQYDVSTHVLEYLPKPKSSGKRGAMMMKENSRNILMKQGEHLGVQSNHNKRSSEMGMANQDAIMDMDPEFESMIAPEDMRLLGLVSHNNMKGAMRQFVEANVNALKKFRLTGTNTTMTMLKEVFGDDPEVIYGPSCKSGPLGGDAQLVAMAVTGLLGACVFFIDPMDAHPHSADIECLVRQGNVHNILMMNNPSTAHVCMNSMRIALKMGRIEMIPSFFFDLESPSVEAYKARQKTVLHNAMDKATAILPTRESRIFKSMAKSMETKQELVADNSEDKVEKVMAISSEGNSVRFIRENFSLILVLIITFGGKLFA